MHAFLNGQFLPIEQAQLPLSDRGLLYGDGLFETLRARQGQLLRWERHLARLKNGAAFLRIPLRMSDADFKSVAEELIRTNAMPEAVLRIMVTRGSGPRGYSPAGVATPTIALTLHPLGASPASVRLHVSSLRRTANDPLAQYKTANKLISVLARAEAEENGADEALLLNTDGHVAEAASSNVFWFEGDTICTPPLNAGILAGVMRAVVLDLCRKEGRPARECLITPQMLLRTDGVFLTNSVTELVPVTALDRNPLPQSPQLSHLSSRTTD